jgi:hypothetical protein
MFRISSLNRYPPNFFQTNEVSRFPHSLPKSELYRQKVSNILIWQQGGTYFLQKRGCRVLNLVWYGNSHCKVVTLLTLYSFQCTLMAFYGAQDASKSRGPDVSATAFAENTQRCLPSLKKRLIIIYIS